MEGKIRKRIGETFENQLKARNKHIAEINNADIKSVRKESKLNRRLKIQVNDIGIDTSNPSELDLSGIDLETGEPLKNN